MQKKLVVAETPKGTVTAAIDFFARLGRMTRGTGCWPPRMDWAAGSLPLWLQRGSFLFVGRKACPMRHFRWMTFFDGSC